MNPQHLTDQEVGFGAPAAGSSKSKADNKYLSDVEAGFEPPSRGFKGWVGDALGVAARGAISVPEAAVGLLDIPTGGAVGKALENEGGSVGLRFKQAKEAASDLFDSDATKQQNQQFQQADGIVEKAKVALSNPSMVVRAVGESLPAMGAGGVASRGLMAATKLGQMGTAGAALAGAAGEGITMAGSAAEQIRQETPDGLLTPTQSGLAAATGVAGAAIGALGGRVAQKLGIGDAETLLAQGTKGMAKANADDAARAAVNPLVQQQAAKSIPRRVVEGAIAEGFLEELPQSVAEQVFQNVALGKDWLTDVDAAVVMGVLSGSAMGGAAAGYHGFRQPKAGEPGAAPGNAQPAGGEQPGAAVRNPGMDRIQQAFADQLSALQQQEQGDPAVPQTTPPDGAAALAQQQAQAAAQRQAAIDASRAVQSPDDEIYQSTGATVPRSVAMGLDPAAGPLSASAALAVDSGASDQVQQAAALTQAAEAAQKQGKKPAKSNQKQEQQSIAQQGVNAETGEISQGSAMEGWSDAQLSDTFRGAQSREVRMQLAQELGRRRALRDQQELQAELDAEQRGSVLGAERADAAFASLTEDAGPVPADLTIPATTEGNSNGPQAAQAQQDRAQPSQVGAAPADARGATDAQGRPGANGPQQSAAAGLTDGAQAENLGAQAAPAPSAQAAPKAEDPAQRVARTGDAWTRMPTAERQALAERADLKPIVRKNVPRAAWADLNRDVQRKLAEAMEPVQQAQADAQKESQEKQAGTSANQAPAAINSEADKDGNAIVGRRADGVMIRQDKNGVRWYAQGGVRIEETVSMRPTRQGMQIERGELKPEFMTAAESENANSRPAKMQGKDADKLNPAIEAVREHVASNINKAELIDRLRPLGLTEAQVGSVTMKLGDDFSAADIRAVLAPAPVTQPPKSAAKKKPSTDQTRAKADLMNALADLGDILGKGTRMNIVPEQEQKLLPVLTRVLDAAFRLGYHKFKDSAKFALDQIRTHLGDEAADALTLDHLQGAYIAMAGGKTDADTKRAVIDVESKAEIEAHEATATDDEQEPAANERTLTQALRDELAANRMPKDNPALKKLVEAFDGKPADQARMKQAQEALEAAIVQEARTRVEKLDKEGPRTTFASLVRLYESQPLLNVRTSTSIANQAYSTPAPLAYLASKLAGINPQTRVHEPTGGTGMLLIGTDPKNAVVNELNDLRVSLLKEQGFNPTQKDAAIGPMRDGKGPVDAVITNPPFGSVKGEDGKPVKVKVDGYNIGQIDHLIAAHALATMKDDGRAVLILGANKAPGGLSTDDRIFFNWLYSHYNVTGHFEVEGDLYARQGAGWPVRVIVINGREKSANISPVAGTIQRADNWDQVYEQFNQILGSGRRPVRGAGDAAGRASDSQARPAGVPGNAGAEAAGSGGRVATAGADSAGNVAGAGAGTVADRTGATTDPVGHIPDEQRLNGQSFVPPGLVEARPGADAPANRPAKPAGTTAVAAAPAAAGNEFQSPYVPRSARKDAGVLIPSNMAQPTQDALNRLEDAVGDIDEFARKELGYESTEALHNALMGLQVDSVATAIYQIKQNKAVVIADQTGIGKGRQAASIIRWAARNGMTPVFVSVKPSLFTDMYGDLADIGTHDVAPFILNSSEWVSGTDGEKLFSNKPSTHRAAIQSIVDNAALPQGRNALFMTYSQINTANLQRQALMALAPNAVFVLDESHNAAGDSGTGDFMISVLKEARGVTYLSATYAKRPDNMPLYFKTDIGDAAADSEGLADAMAAGGLPLQTVVSNNLVKAGQMFRRERSYDGVSIASTFDTANRQLHERLSDEATEALRAIVSADKMFHSVFVKSMDKALKAEGSKVQDNAGNQVAAGVQHTEFSSVVHNFVRQMLLGLKAQTAADEAIASLKRGEKPIIAVENTMGSFLSEYAAQNNINQGDSLGAFDYRTVLSRALERSRVINVVLPTGEKDKKNIPLSQLDPITRKAYDQAQKVIDRLAIDIPVSPIDWMRAEIARAGFSVAEITGRDLSVDYSNPRKPVLSAIDLTEQRDKVASTRRFNGGELDALILNVAGSTGISLHASEKFSDQRQRHMIVAQAAGDINIFMQMLGRVHRTGQVRLPKYTILSVDLPTEKRPTAVLSRKMKSLNANTSSNTESATSVKTADILNKYGDQIVNQYLVDNLALANQLDVDDLLSSDGERVTDDIARKATGRLALQPIEVQRAFYEDVEAQYDALIEYLNKTNQNDLEPRTFDFDAKEVRTEILFDGPNKATPFGEDAVYGEYSIKAQGVAMKPEEIQAAIAESLQGKSGADHARDLLNGLLQTYVDQTNAAMAQKVGQGAAFDLDQYAAFLKPLFGEDGAARMMAQAQAFMANGTPVGQLTARDLSGAQGVGAGMDFLRNHTIGKTFRVEINSEPYNAVITNVRNTHKTTGNPFSLSKFQITLAVNGALRSITVPATQFRKIEVSSIAPAFRIETLFKEQPANQRETAKIVTGNLLAAYGEIKGARGTIISFTKADGVIEQGILLPKLFDFSKNTQGDYRLRSGADALKFLQQSTNKDIGRFGIATRDGQVRVLPRGDGVQVRVPKSKAQGARYFLDKNLIDVAGDFVSSANAMVANVDDAASAEKVLDLLMDKQALYALPSMADEAKSMATPISEKNPPVAAEAPERPPAFRREDEGRATPFDVGAFLKARGRPSAYSEAAQRQAIDSVSATVDAIRTAWGPNAPEVVVAFDMQDQRIPEAARKADLRQRSGGARGAPEGFYYDGKAYLMASRLNTPNDAARVLYHEVLGHHGLRGKFGSDLDQVLNQIATMRKAEVAAKMQEYGLRGVNSLSVREAAEEVLAEMAEKNPRLPFVQRAISAIRNFLRQHVPGFQSLRLTDNDIIQAYILPARGWVERGARAATSEAEPVFAVNFARHPGFSAAVDAAVKAGTEGAPGGRGHVEIGTLPPALAAAGVPAGDLKTSAKVLQKVVFDHGVPPSVVKRIPELLERPVMVFRSATVEGSFVAVTSEMVRGAPLIVAISPETTRGAVALNFVPSLYPRDDLQAIQRWLNATKPGEQLLTYLDKEQSPAWFGSTRLQLPGEFRTTQGLQSRSVKTEADAVNGDVGGEALFSRAKLQDIKVSALDQFQQAMSHEGKVSLWDKTVGTMRNLGERSPAFKPVYEAAQRFIDDVSMLGNDAADRAPRLLPRVETLADLKKKPITAADNQAVAKPLFEGTLLWARDVDGTPVTTEALNAKYRNSTPDEKAQILLRTGKIQEQMLKVWRGLPVDQYNTIINNKFDSTILKPGVVWTEKELKELFGLSAQQVSLYQEARAAIDRSIDMTARADMLRALGAGYADLREAVLAQATAEDAMVLITDTLQAEARENPDQADRVLSLNNAVVKSHERAQALMDAGYAPLSRFGRYTVDVVGKDGTREYFGMFESMYESNKMKAAMEKEFPGATVTQGTMSDEAFKLFQGVTPESLEHFGQMLGLSGEGTDPKDKAFQAYLQLAKNNHSALKRLIHRKGISGYSEDVGRVLASFVYSNARLAAGGLNAGTLETAIEGIPKEQGELRDVAMGLRSYIQDPQEEGQAVRGMLFAQYLGGSVASAVVNMTQPFQITMPWLSQYGGMRSAASHLAGAVRDMTRRSAYEPDLAKALHTAEAEGIVSPQEIHQLMAQARGTGSLRTGDGTKLGDARAAAANNWERVKVAWGQPFALAEQFNRRSTFIAAYRIAKEQGMADPAKFAERAVLETQFVYSKANKPKWARGAIGGTLFTFKTYSVSYLELMHRMWSQGGPEGKRAVGWAVAMLLLMGGAGGLPFMEDAEDLIDGAGQLMGYNVSTKQWRKQALRDVVGKELADFVENGVSGLPGAPIDVSGRLGMGNLIPGTGLLLSKQSRERDLLEVAGPAGDLVARGFTGARKLLTGDVAGAALEVSPTAVRNAAKGIDMATSGIYKDTKGYKVIDTTLDEAVAKAIGFQPKSVAEVQEANSFMQRSKSFYTQTSSDIKAQWAQAVFEKDEAALQRVRDRLAAWNRNNPDQPIVVKIPDVMKRVREMGKDRTQRIADTAPKALRQQMRDMARETSQGPA